jgi:hypothetical protein
MFCTNKFNSSAKAIICPHFLEHRSATDRHFELSTKQENTRQLSVQRIDLLWRWAESVLDHGRNLRLHTSSRVLLSKIERLVRLERLSENHDRVNMSLFHDLQEIDIIAFFPLDFMANLYLCFIASQKAHRLRHF